MDTLVLDEFLAVQVTPDKMSASLVLKQAMPGDFSGFHEQILLQFVNGHGVTAGIHRNALDEASGNPDRLAEPICIAEGIRPIPGTDGYLKSELQEGKQGLSNKDKVNFWELNKIPVVSKDQKIAVIVPPGKGEDGADIFGAAIPAPPGKPFRLRPGKNIAINEKTGTVTALTDGQVSIAGRSINVFPVYEVAGDLDMKTGNIDFPGNVLIKGNVPAGFRINARGDIRVMGLVEAATLTAGGSIMINGGVVAANKGVIRAGEHVKVTYINQGNVEAGKSIMASKSVMHSLLTAGEDIICEHGHAVGGALSAGRFIHVKEGGNKLQTRTEFYLGVSQYTLEQHREMSRRKLQLEDQKTKLVQIGRKLNQLQIERGLSAKERILLLRQKNSLKEASDELAFVYEELYDIEKKMDGNRAAEITVTDTLYPNVDINFGKYRRRIRAPAKHIKMKLVNSEIKIEQL